MILNRFIVALIEEKNKMDKTIEQIFKVFSHLSREIQTYIFTGLILVFDFYIIDYVYYSSQYSRAVSSFQYFGLIILVGAYIIGQICLGFYCLVLEITRFDKFLYKVIFKRRYPNITDATDEAMIEDKGIIFKKDKELYFHFIERNVNLGLMRWNFSSAFLIITIINIGFCIFSEYNKETLEIGLFSFFISICLMLLHIMTQKENALQIMKLKEE